MKIKTVKIQILVNQSLMPYTQKTIRTATDFQMLEKQFIYFYLQLCILYMCVCVCVINF